MSSMLTLINLALDELILPRLAAGDLTGTSTVENVKLYAALINRQGRALRDVKEGGWTILQRLHTFNTVASTDEYALPSDYVRLINSTVWDRTLLTPAIGPISPLVWQTIKSGLVGTGAYSPRYRIVRSTVAATFERKFIIDPVPTAVEAMAFEYLSTFWATNSAGSTGKSTISLDTDNCLLDDDLMVMGMIWRWRRALGYEYASSLAEYNERLDQKMADDAPAQGVSLSGSPDTAPFLGYPNIPETGFG